MRFIIPFYDFFPKNIKKTRGTGDLLYIDQGEQHEAKKCSLGVGWLVKNVQDIRQSHEVNEESNEKR